MNAKNLEQVGARAMTAEDIRSALQARYPDVDDDQFSIDHSGFIHEHPLTAIGVVLISSVLLGTTDIDRLAEFTKYSKRFIRAIAMNMENSRLWKSMTAVGGGNCLFQS
jgi:hypothetical protein